MINIDDRMAILDLCSRYNYFFDTGSADQWADTFTADGTFDGPFGHAEGRDELIAFCLRIAEESPGGMHFTDNHLFETREHFVLHTCFLSYQTPTETGTDILLLEYKDELVQVGADWLFRERKVAPIAAPD